MKIYSWNVNGLRALQKKGFKEWILSESPDILCLQETKVSPDQLDDEIIHIEGYRSYFHSAKKKGYSGVAVYAKNEPAMYREGLGIGKFDEEGRVQTLEYRDFTLVNAYFPNGQMSDGRLAYKMEFNDEIMKYCDSLKAKGAGVIICGDFNTAHREIDLKNPKSNEKRSGFLPAEREWIDRFIAGGYIDIFRALYPEKITYSWWSYMFRAREKDIGWRIDYFFISENFRGKVKDAGILTHVTGSDHCPVTLYL